MTLTIVQRITLALFLLFSHSLYAAVTDVTKYEAIPDDGLDDTAAINFAIDVAINTNQVLYFPAGIYDLSAKIARSITVDRRGLKIEGEGSELSVIRWNTTDGGFDFTLNNTGKVFNGNKIHIVGVSLTTSVNNGTAFAVNGGTTGGEATEGVTIRDVVVRGDNTSAYWDTGLYIADSTKTNISEYGYLGHRPSTFSPANMRGTGIVFTKPGDHFISDSRISFFDKGVNVTGSTEGVYISNVAMVAGNIGINWESLSELESLLTVTNTHFNTYLRAIKAINVTWVDIKGGLTLQFNAGVPTGPYIGIELAGTLAKQRNISIDGIIMNLDDQSFSSAAINMSECSEVRIRGIGIENNAPGNSGVNGIQIANCDDVLIHGSTMRNLETHILINEKSSNITMNGNIFRDGMQALQVYASTGYRARNIMFSNNNILGITNQSLNLDSVNECTIANNIDGSSPINGTLNTHGTNAYKGRYRVMGNHLYATAPGLIDPGSVHMLTANTVFP